MLPFALPERVVAAAARTDAGWTACSDFTDETVSFGDAEAAAPGAVTGWGAYVAGVVWALSDAGFDVPPARLALASDVPVGAGLSSSHALECAVLTALARAELGWVPEKPTLQDMVGDAWEFYRTHILEPQ